MITGLDHVWKEIEKEGIKNNWGIDKIKQEQLTIAGRYFRGIDKDAFLSKVTKVYMAIVGDGRGGVFCENSLKDPEKWSAKTRDKVDVGLFDVIVTNPPLGIKDSS